MSRSFDHKITTVEEFCEQVTTFAGNAVTKLRAQRSNVREMVVFAMTNRFKEDLPQTNGGICTVFPDGTADYRTIIASAASTARELFRTGFGYKKAGVVFTKIEQEGEYVGSLFADEKADVRNARLSESIDMINKVFGKGAVLFGIQRDGQFHIAQQHRSPHYTTLWKDLPTASIK